ncbi:hypothetical protein LTR05_004837 [Lithohypha guttulata]|uniref:Fe2OG dioxygenase domain-containing protein n=1 Tax=Lithohypha guttulata TaxID=1690604 RepID=A0AAN7SZ80_9EURO|nr:hypothetical protein LTR05_004837 [Lithohypha guttulata]
MTSQIAMTGVEQDGLRMPVIDFGAFRTGDPQQRQQVADQVVEAFKNSGFLYLKNHGIPKDQVQTVFRTFAKFFERPQAQKDELAWTTPRSNRGYVTSGREKVTHSNDPEEVAKQRASNPDLKESMEIGREGVEGMPNQWPDRFGDEDGITFTKLMKQFFLTCKDLHVNVMRAIAVGMGLEEQFFDTFTDGGDNNLRLLHYPPVRKSVFLDKPDQVRAGEHSDYGSITLLFQDNVGGLEVKSPRGTWVRATPIPDTIVINAGDLLSRWSNETIKSTNHRVIQPPPKDGEMDDADNPNACFSARYSIAYFCNPNFDKLIEALPGTFENEAAKKYAAVNSGDYLEMRLAATY